MMADSKGFKRISCISSKLDNGSMMPSEPLFFAMNVKISLKCIMITTEIVAVLRQFGFVENKYMLDK